MSKQILVCLPLREEQKRAMQQAAPEAEFRFTVPADVTAEDVRWADAVLGNVPVELIRQNERLEWFQSNTAGPDAYLAPGVLPERCVVTNATGAYGLAISEWMLGMWLGLQKDLFLYRDRQNRSEWAIPSAACTVRGCSASAWGTSVRTLPAGRTHWGPRWWASAARSTRTPPAPITVCGWCPKARWTLSCPKPTLWP